MHNFFLFEKNLFFLNARIVKSRDVIKNDLSVNLTLSSQKDTQCPPKTFCTVKRGSPNSCKSLLSYQSLERSSSFLVNAQHIELINFEDVKIFLFVAFLFAFFCAQNVCFGSFTSGIDHHRSIFIKYLCT